MGSSDGDGPGLDLAICNEGNAPTFRRGASEFIIDVTWADEDSSAYERMEGGT